MNHENAPESVPTPSAVIDLLGGTVATAKLCEVSSQAVTQWRSSGIPRARVQFLRLARPDVFAQAATEAGHAG